MSRMDSQSSLVALPHLSESKFSHVECTSITKHTRLVVLYFNSKVTLGVSGILLWFFTLEVNCPRIVWWILS